MQATGRPNTQDLVDLSTNPGIAEMSQIMLVDIAGINKLDATIDAKRQRMLFDDVLGHIARMHRFTAHGAAELASAQTPRFVRVVQRLNKTSSHNADIHSKEKRRRLINIRAYFSIHSIWMVGGQMELPIADSCVAEFAVFFGLDGPKLPTQPLLQRFFVLRCQHAPILVNERLLLEMAGQLFQRCEFCVAESTGPHLKNFCRL